MGVGAVVGENGCYVFLQSDQFEPRSFSRRTKIRRWRPMDKDTADGTVLADRTSPIDLPSLWHALVLVFGAVDGENGYYVYLHSVQFSRDESASKKRRNTTSLALTDSGGSTFVLLPIALVWMDI